MFARVGEAGKTGRCALPVSNRQPHPEPTLGAQLSEVLNEEVGKEESGFSRRRVVAGVAWSLPVIATAVAAPAAAASPPPISVTATWGAGGTQYTTVGGGNPRMSGTCPAKLSIKNTGASSFTGTISMAITLTPVGTVLAGIGVESLQPATVTAPSTFKAHASSATFSYSGSIGSGTTLDFPIRFHYESVSSKPKKVSYSYAMTTSLVLTSNSGSSASLAPTTPDPTINF
ncbi:hypothetical protein J2T22_001268 [Pseudarthrobacter defluvii]|uniref:Choice-of-anchor D domain-containing protein n=1 Tax=Pseudarthrobacter defluvii TaxID=410837 RepID=A0ABT9UGG1_9MICC|nr:hypothetical protein [Pseudarthrobacter defluvii]